MEDLLAGLNAAQREAVTTTEGFVRVIAGAGSGKTRALTRRFAYLVNELGILPGHILCVTFTNKSAGEMRQRIRALIGDSDTGYINTFHGFCVSVLQEDSHAVGYPKSFLVLDNSDIDAMLGIIYEERGLTLRDMTFGDARDMIEIRKLFKDPDYYLDVIEKTPDELRARYEAAATASDIIFYGYLYQARKCFGVDYNDLIKFSLYIFQKDADIRRKWQERLEYIMIDEFQDIDALQYELMEVLCGYHKNLFIVGDPDQTIYTWRGANVKYLTEFDRAFPQVQTVMMMQNYRSTPEILAAANALIEKNHFRIEKTLVPMLPGGVPVLCHFAVSQAAEAEWIADEMQKLCAAGVPYRDMTVLYRAHYVSRAVEEVLLAAKIPYAIYSGVQFFDRAEIKDALSYLRIIVYRDDLSFRRIANTPRRNLGKSRMARLEAYAEEKQCSLYTALCDNIDTPEFKTTKGRQFIALVESFAAGQAERPISEVLTELLERSGYETMLRTEGSQERLDNLAELKQSIYEYETTCGEESTLEAYLARVALMTNTDTAARGDCVKLMTVHAAKGLEFPYVFLCGMNEGVFPSRKVRTLPGMEEERRLAFVALTRAERGLYLSEADGWNFDGSTRYPSRFLLDIGRDALTYTKEPREGLIRETERAVADSLTRLSTEGQAATFAVGDRVRHAVFGDGTVLAADTDEKCYTIRFDGMETPRAIAFRVRLVRADS